MDHNDLFVLDFGKAKHLKGDKKSIIHCKFSTHSSAFLKDNCHHERYRAQTQRRSLTRIHQVLVIPQDLKCCVHYIQRSILFLGSKLEQ